MAELFILLMREAHEERCVLPQPINPCCPLCGKVLAQEVTVGTDKDYVSSICVDMECLNSW